MKKKLIAYKIFITKYAGNGKILARKAALSGFKVVAAIALSFLGTHTKLKIVEVYRAKKVEIEADREVPVTVDGEILYIKNLEIKVEKDAIKLCTL